MVGCWRGYLCGARCKFGYGPADPTASHCMLLQEIQMGFGFTFQVLARPGSPGQNPESRKRVVIVVVLKVENCTVSECVIAVYIYVYANQIRVSANV